MKGFIVLFKVKDEDAKNFNDLLMEDYIHKTHNISELAEIKGVCGGDDFESNANAFFHEL